MLRAEGPELIYAPSATHLLRYGRRTAERAAESCLAVGFNGLDQATLRFAEEEARSIARLTGGRALTGSTPKKTTLYRQASHYRILHFSCHGDFNPEAPLMSALHLAPDEALTALDVLEQLRLRCDLVTLEQVRKALARDLHDGPTQLISAIVMQLAFCQKAMEKDPSLVPAQITSMQKLAAQAIHQMRTLLIELHPLTLETQGLEAALRILLERRQQEIETSRLTLNVDTCQPGGVISRQPARVEAAIFAVVQEAVNNALKHAQADNVLIQIEETPKAIRVVIVDDGVGFDLEETARGYEDRGSLGLVNIQERMELVGGQATLESAPGQGTRVSLCVPRA